MKKILALVLSALLLVTAFAGCSGSSQEKGELVLFTWEGMFPQEVLDGFTEETGIEVTYANFDYDETMLAKLETAKGGEYDLVIADDYIIETVIAEGLAQKLDTSKLENYGSINPVYQGQFFDPQNEYTVPYGAGVQTIVYDPNLVDVEINGYADLWDPSLAGNVGIIDNFRVVNGMALKVLGESYNTEDTATIESAGEKLQELAPNIRLIKDQNTQDDLLSGEVGAAVLYTSQVTLAKMANPDLKVVFPEEGVGFGIMAQFIPSNAPHADNAYKFIDYILRPEISAQCFEYIGYYCTNKDAEEHISEEYRDFLTLPEDIDTDSMEMIENISADAIEVHQRVWTEFKSACGQ
jgi:spermidine/putrescine transport system substrate-binding protein